MKRATLMALFLLVAAGCGSDGDDAAFDVSTSVVSHETTQGISVWAPDAEGPWPIVYAVHGSGADRSRWDVMGPELASRGVVVFAPDYRSTESQHVEQDIVCAWRYAAGVADEYGGDLDQPITFVGHSQGATMVFIAGLDETAYGPGGTYDRCLAAAPMPRVIVPISGCHYEFGGTKTDFAYELSRMPDREVDVVLVVGSDDEACEPWQSQDASKDLQAEGYDVSLVEIDGADHFAVIFKDLIDGEVTTLPDEPAGIEVVQTILDAIDAAGP
ncbi:MAG: alpha/beta fold hydrolase [Actinomycetia bacterium]|nr:alpha/beta fold hydrolase [Actinomycetes bacterium]